MSATRSKADTRPGAARTTAFHPLRRLAGDGVLSPMDDETLNDFIVSFYEDVADALDDADKEPSDAQYRLGVGRLAKAPPQSDIGS